MLLRDYPKGYDLTILNTSYTFPKKDPETDKYSTGSIDLVVKDNHTGEKFVETIEDPDYEFYFAKDDVVINHHLFFIEQDKVDKITVPYKDLLYKIAELTDNVDMFFDNIRTGNRRANEELHTHNRVFLSDTHIEDHYRFRFNNEYTNNIVPVTKAFFDIEADTINMFGDFPEMGECPINAVSLIDDNTNTIYVFLLRNKKNPLIEEFERNINANLIKELREFIIDAVGGWKQAVRLGVDKLDFKFMMYDEEEEIKLIQDLFIAINTIKPDFLLAWNMAFDIPYIIARIENLGYDPRDIICHPDFKYKQCTYVVDERHKNEFAERGDYAKISSYSVFLDQMIQFASRRKGQSAIRSYKLDDIGDMVAGVRKLDYKHITDKLQELPYKDYKTFVFYNIMDTIVQKCVEKKTGDIDFVFNKALSNNTRYGKVHRQTVYLANRAASDFYKDGYIMGNNVNKTAQKESFDGAFVADPTKTSDYSKLKIYGIPINVYDNLNDFDYARLYPSITQEFNMAPNTQIGKVTFPKQIDDNENKYNRETWQRQIQYMEDLHSGVYIEFCTRWLHLADYSSLYDDIIFYFSNIKASQRPLRYFSTEAKLLPFYHIPSESKINPFIKYDKPYNPFIKYTALKDRDKERIYNAINK